MDVIAMGTFLECLEPYIINDKLRVMPPVVMKDFVTHYEQKSMLESVETCIVHMDVSSLDIHQVSSVFICSFVVVGVFYSHIVLTIIPFMGLSG